MATAPAAATKPVYPAEGVTLYHPGAHGPFEHGRAVPMPAAEARALVLDGLATYADAADAAAHAAEVEAEAAKAAAATAAATPAAAPTEAQQMAELVHDADELLKKAQATPAAA
jgi:hypothetical protein